MRLLEFVEKYNNTANNTLREQLLGTIKITPYISIIKKDAYAQLIVNKTTFEQEAYDNNGKTKYRKTDKIRINSVAQYIQFCRAVIELYTDLEIDENDKGFINGYDALKSSGLLDILMIGSDKTDPLIPMSELSEFKTILTMKQSDTQFNETTTQAEKCRFSNITVSGKATIGGAGIVDSAQSCDFTDCTSKVNADIKVTDALPGFFAGISWGDENSNFRNCRNKGNITLTGAWNEDTSFSVYGIAMITKKIEKCVNTGNLTIKNTAKGDAGLGLEFEACGVAGSCYGQAKGCGNTGKISVTNQGGKTSRAVVKVCGIEAAAVKIKQCYNKGAVSFTGVCSGRDYEGDNEVAGVGFAASMSECYNTGKITVNTKNGFTNVGGVSYCGTKIKNCYNTGTVSLTGKGYAGGVVGEFRDGSCNYNVGKVTAKGKYAMAGEIAGYVSGENTVSDNYYTGSGKKSGREYTSWVPYQSKAKKVSSITSANCPKLSSKYWTYSSKHKRLILKNNKEA